MATAAARPAEGPTTTAAAVVAALADAAAKAPAAPAKQGCGKRCLGPCCLPGSQLPRYCCPSSPKQGWSRRNLSFTNLSQCNSTTSLSESSASDTSSEEEASPVRPRSILDSLIVSMWDARFAEGLFRYSVSSCETRTIPGARGFVAQFNEGRHSKKRPTEFRMDAVAQPFDSTKFNFAKVGVKEALFTFEPNSAVPGGALTSPGAEPEGDDVSGCGAEDEDSVFAEDATVPLEGKGRSPNIVAINVSPIEYGHILLIPRILDQIPQCMDAASLLLALRFAAEVDNPSFRLGYNSLGAFATVNHLHFQGYYMEQPFAIELASTTQIWGSQGSEGLTVSLLQDYPVRGFAFHIPGNPKGASDVIASLCAALETRNVPFNLFITSCGSKVFLYPQCYAERQAKGEVEEDLLATEVNSAVFEISGHMVMKRKQDFEDIDEALAERLLSAVSLSEERFADIVSLCMNLLQ